MSAPAAILLGGLAAAFLALLAGFIVSQARHRRVLRRLDIMLEEALRGTFRPSEYDESQLSKIEAGMNRLLGAVKLKAGQLEGEQARVHRLIGDISHQTKTPIANLLLYAQLLGEQADLPPSAAALAAQLGRDAEKLSFLVQALVKASRLESGILKMNPRRQDLAGLMAAAREQVLPAAMAKGVRVELLPPHGPIFALFDAKWCAEALFNILDNAVKYTPAGGAVTLQATGYELFCRVDVADEGPGIAEADLPRVFSRFWRGQNAAEREGVGIGLYLAREIAAACGGYVKASSPPGAGATFSLFLPAAR